MKNEVRQILTCHAGQSLMDERNVLHITLGGALDSSLDAPQKFNLLPAAERTRIARQALAQAGAINVREAPGSMNLVEGAPARAMDAAPRKAREGIFGHICGPSGITEEPAKDSETRAGMLHRALDHVLDELERKGRRRNRKRRPERDLDNRVAADARRMSRRDQQTLAAARFTRDSGERALGNHGNMTEFRRLAGVDAAAADDGGDGAWLARAANLTCGLGA
jgi:hypothetical protein